LLLVLFGDLVLLLDAFGPATGYCLNSSVLGDGVGVKDALTCRGGTRRREILSFGGWWSELVLGGQVEAFWGSLARSASKCGGSVRGRELG